MMREVFELPPNFDAIVARFASAAQKNVLFAYGDVIYNPSFVRIPPQLIVHENVHGARQLAYGVEAWWERYLADSAFCLAEEIPAHRAEYAAILNGTPLPSRSEQKRQLARISDRLSGPLYNHAISLADAVNIIGGHRT